MKVNKFRVALSKFRVSSHRLEIKVGRWTKPNKTPIENLKCRICGTVEDEFHFLFECPLYVDLRIKHLKRYYRNRPNMLKLQELMLSNNIAEIRNLSMFVEKAFKIRTELYTQNRLHDTYNLNCYLNKIFLFSCLFMCLLFYIHVHSPVHTISMCMYICMYVKPLNSSIFVCILCYICFLYVYYS